MNAPVKSPPVTFAEAFVKLQADIKPALKDATNPAFRSKYADLGAVWEAVKEPLHANGFAIIQSPDFDGEQMWLSTTIMHVSGESRSGRYPLRPMKPDPQGYGSAMTYARRYSISAMLGVISEEDDDGNKASERPNVSNAQRDAIHTPKTMGGSEAHPNSAPPVGEDPDVVEGVNNWVAKQSAAIAKCERLPELLQWQDEQEDALNRLLKKYPAGHRKIMDQFEARKKAIGKS